jgi:hypothetical protein
MAGWLLEIAIALIGSCENTQMRATNLSRGFFYPADRLK